MLDGYDFTIVTLVLIDIQRDFRIDNAALGALGTITLLTRLVGGVIAGAAADRWGRKLPLMVSIAWFSVFAFASGLSTSYAMLFAFRALFGLGMGGEWAAGMPLVLEHFPEHRRGLVLGVLQGAFSWGFILAAAMFQFVVPIVEHMPAAPWRILMWTGVVPAFLVLWIRSGVAESPLWLAGRARAAAVASPAIRAVLRPGVIVTTVTLCALMFSYQSMSFWYASLLRLKGLTPLPYLAALNVGGILGAAAWGRLADTRLGPRRAIAAGALLSILALPLFLLADSELMLVAGALGIGLTGAGVIGVAPAFVGRHFETATRATGWGVVYHVAAAAGALSPYLLGKLQDAGWALSTAMATGIGIASVIVIATTLGAPPRTAGSNS